MFWKKHFMTERFAMAVSLFLIGALHTMIFGTFQIPSHDILQQLGKEHLIVYSKSVCTQAQSQLPFVIHFSAVSSA